MATLVRSLLKLMLFLGLLFFFMGFAHVVPYPLTVEQQHVLITFADWLHIQDYEALYMIVATLVDVLVTTLAYRTILKLWRRYRMRRGSVRV